MLVAPEKTKKVPVPEKRLFGNNNPLFVEKRMSELRSVLQAVVNDPDLAFHQVTWSWFTV